MPKFLASTPTTPVRAFHAHMNSSTLARIAAVAETTDMSVPRQPLPTTPLPATAEKSSGQVFEELTKSHWNRLYRLIIKNIGHRDDAEDLTQQAFTEAIRSYHHFRGDSELSTWLYGIAMNLVRNHLSRASHRRFGFFDEDELNEMPSEQANPEESAVQAQHLRALGAALDDLPEHMREIVSLMAMDDLSYEDAAALLDLPVGTVRSRLSRARSTLKARLSERGIVLEFF